MDMNIKTLMIDDVRNKVIPLLHTVGYALGTDNISRLEDIQGALYIAIDNLVEIIENCDSKPKSKLLRDN